jgi:hypothetical protein
MFEWLRRLFGGGPRADRDAGPIVSRRDRGMGEQGTPPRAERRPRAESERAPLAAIRVALPDDRSQLGTLTALGHDGRALEAARRVAGQANREIAARHRNASADRTRPFGDTPLGDYRLAERIPLRVMPETLAELVGRMDALVFEPAGGEAEEARAAGRGMLVLHANMAGAGCGSLALDPADMRRLLQLAPLDPARAADPITLQVGALSPAQVGKPVAPGTVDVGDPWEAMLVLAGRSPTDDLRQTEDRYDSPYAGDRRASDTLSDLGYGIGAYSGSRPRRETSRSEAARDEPTTADAAQGEPGEGGPPPSQSRDDGGSTGLEDRSGSDWAPTAGAYDR